MVCSRGLILATFFLTLASADPQFVSLPLPLQSNALHGLNQLATEQSSLDLNAKLSQKSVIQVKPIFVPIIVPEQAFQSLASAASQNQIQIQSPFPAAFPNNGAEASIFAALLNSAPDNHRFPDYLAASITNPSQGSTTNQNAQRLNASDAALKELPQLLYDLSFYNAPLPREEISSGKKKDKNAEPLEGLKDIFPANPNLKPTLMESNPHHTAEVLLTDDGVNKILYTKPATNQPSSQDTLLQSLLQSLSTRRRIQERLGAVYLRESLLNRK